ncbi:MAG TPA: type I methionyl aminopeptidase [Candidatus Limnocylindria bacterium]|jgi:methionyl aminopeptidase
MGIPLRHASATIKRPEEVARMREAGRILVALLDRLEAAIAPGVTTGELDAIAADHIREAGAVSSFLGYGSNPPFPATICTSLNEEVVHGIPSRRVIADGDLISVDVGCIWEGWHADCARTFAVGQVSQAEITLIEATRDALSAGIRAATPGNRLGDVGAAIEAVANQHGYGIVRPFVGHGIGTAMHEEPQVPNYGRPGTGMRLEPGMCLAIEPMFNLGDDDVRLLNDGWTVVTADGARSAHFEDTIVIGPTGAERLTARV